MLEPRSVGQRWLGVTTSRAGSPRASGAGSRAGCVLPVPTARDVGLCSASQPGPGPARAAPAPLWGARMGTPHSHPRHPHGTGNTLQGRGGLATLWLQVPVASWLFCPVVGLLGAHGVLWLWVQGGKGSGHSAWREQRHGAGPMLWGAVGIGGALGVPSAVSLAVCGARCGAGCGASCRRMVGRSCWQRGRGCISPCGGGAALILLGGAGAAAPWHSWGSQRAEHRCWHGTVRSWCSVWDPMAMLLRAVN